MNIHELLLVVVGGIVYAVIWVYLYTLILGECIHNIMCWHIQYTECFRKNIRLEYPVLYTCTCIILSLIIHNYIHVHVYSFVCICSPVFPIVPVTGVYP